jgi:uncharacterized membrane-anchored protein YjiN (DUF445 family)
MARSDHPLPGAAPVPAAGDGLRRMRRRATGLLLAAAVVYVVARSGEDGGAAWIGYVRATAEAAMVGGLADWFAVTALFRHPLGLPIPHTAIVPTRKDQLGASLGAFVEEHFLDPDLVGERVAAAGPSQRLAVWLADAGNRAVVTEHAATGLAGALGLMRDERVGRAVGDAVLQRLRALDVATLAGRALDAALAEGRHAPMVSALLGGIADSLVEQKGAFRELFDRESPWWVPNRVDDHVFERIFAGVLHALEDLRADPDHPVRRHLDEQLHVLADRLRTDPVLQARVAGWRDEALEHPTVTAWAASLWDDLASSLRRQADDASSALRSQLAAAVAAAADALATDASLRRRLDGWITSAAVAVARPERHVAGRFIATTVERWDASETADRVEQAVGRDLQFIRINGTVVGGLAGLAIHAVGQLL